MNSRRIPCKFTSCLSETSISSNENLTSQLTLQEDQALADDEQLAIANCQEEISKGILQCYKICEKFRKNIERCEQRLLALKPCETTKNPSPKQQLLDNVELRRKVEKYRSILNSALLSSLNHNVENKNQTLELRSDSSISADASNSSSSSSNDANVSANISGSLSTCIYKSSVGDRAIGSVPRIDGTTTSSQPVVEVTISSKDSGIHEVSKLTDDSGQSAAYDNTENLKKQSLYSEQGNNSLHNFEKPDNNCLSVQKIEQHETPAFGHSGNLEGNREDATLSGSASNTLSTSGRGIKGLTGVAKEIYVIHDRQNQIEVYALHNTKVVSRYLVVPNVIEPQDLVSCSRGKALYISDGALKAIVKFRLRNKSVSLFKLREKYTPRNLSITQNQNLLVTACDSVNDGKSVVLEYTSAGQLVRKVNLDRSITWASQALELPRNEYIICYGVFSSPLNRLCLINHRGQIVAKYCEDGPESGPNNFNEPQSVAIDYNNRKLFIFDVWNKRVLELNYNLSFSRAFMVPDNFVRPCKLYFESTSSKLLIGEESNKEIFDIDTKK